ncbi:hypothetical protein RDV89_17525 [Nocardioides zeae]|uniref:Uncharacterized protein n=1 Tax=Nocardioides imazamoxiresistens TaxID=3231893 RepID=A0ABU3Q049_9ACTN|nr:hypothetical protein [Nocardioides zeae]MDT9594893.1 hypothetical protein [Nocardioides zeae]
MDRPGPDWTRRRLQVVLIGGLLCSLLLLAGGAYAVVDLLGGEDRSEAPSDTTRSGGSAAGSDSAAARDEIAEAPMPSVPPSAALPGTLSAEAVGVLTLPPPAGVGAAGVPTGFPQTAEGALAQLAAINRSALEGTSLRHAQDIIGAWAEPGGPDASSWSGVAAVATLLAAAEAPAEGTSTVQVEFAPSMGLIKGALDGYDNPLPGGTGDVPAFVVPCVVHVLTVTTRVGVDRTAVADCQRMTWVEDDPGRGRWVIDAGAEPAPAPSTWPGTAASIDAGYLWLDQLALRLGDGGAGVGVPDVEVGP